MTAVMRRIQTGNALAWFGPGLTAPLLYVYVAQVRALGSLTAGLTVTAFAAAALVVLPLVGTTIARRGPRPVLLAGLVAAALGSACLGVATTVTTTLIAGALAGAGQAVVQPSIATMIADCSTPQTRSRAFALQFFFLNLGVGLGGLAAGHLVDLARPATFTRVFAICAAAYLASAAVMATVRTPAAVRLTPGGGRVSWRELLHNRTMVLLCVLGFVVFFAFYGQFDAGLAAFGLQVAHISPSTLGTALAANTAMIAIAQFAVLRLAEQHRRTTVIAAVGLLWVVAWSIAGYAGLVPGSGTATVAFVAAYVLFGLGEAMLSPTLAPLVPDIAPEGMAGPYNAAFSLVKQVALAIGPVAGGPIATLLPAPYIVAFALVSLGITALALRTARHLSTAQNHPAFSGTP
ncbi:MFS transporter [Actinoplanes sp. NPDC051851]|uniref:MFS transporter n=1 Tax=Actinoplanes sp. NPDC051851 TaxID=3154753 RepID=UPI0034392AD4